jgi:hypothetical protein
MTSALLLGDAECVFQDAAEALDNFEFDIIAACTNIGITWQGHVHHWFTLHPNKAPDWVGLEEAIRRRTKLAGLNRPVTWSYKAAKGVDHVVDDWQGGTGLFGIKVLLQELHCDAIVLAGVPMTSEGKHFYSKSPWLQAHKYYKGWHKHLHEFAPYVRSMSGWTRQLLGAP